jgi:hypothetical protein
MGKKQRHPARKARKRDKLSARFEGRVAATFLEDGRRIQLLEQFAYIDKASERWDVPVGAIVDGASIPKPLWSLMGGPFEGKYRDSSVIHDWYCDLRVRPWEAVHLVFYEAMMTSGVSKTLAKIMYAGVYWGGPRWSGTVSQNVRAALAWEKRVQHFPELENSAIDYDFDLPEKFSFPLTDSDLAECAELIEKNDLSLAEIRELIEGRLAAWISLSRK